MHDTRDQSQVSYGVTVHPDRHEMAVTMRLSGPVAQGTIHLEIPTWVPGDYTFMQLARDLFEVTAENTATGQALSVARDGWQAFRIEGGQGDVTVNYRASAYEPDFGEPSGIVDSAYAVILGTRYLHSPAHLGACTVAYDLPPAWQDTVHHPSGAERGAAPNTWHYPSYEILLDTPVVMGGYELLTREVMGTPFYFVFVDQGVGFVTVHPSSKPCDLRYLGEQEI